MNRQMQRVPFLLLYFLLAASLNASAAVRVAIVSKADVPGEASSLLTAEFSKLADVSLLERFELDRVLREQSLAATSSQNFLKAAQILGADAVLFLEKIPGATNQVIGARLALTRQGAIIHAIRAPWSAAWIETMRREFAPVIPKSALPPDRAVKLSVLNLRSPGNTAASEALDRQLTTLLLLRLEQEPELLVLERRKLADLANEKELADASEKFWTGSHLLDGTVNKDGIKPGVVTLSIRLQKPNGTTQIIDAAGETANLVPLVEDVVAKILSATDRSAKVQWDSKLEAAQHLDEATWALRWQMYEEAQAAADSAWALGLQTADVARARTLAYARTASHADRTWDEDRRADRFQSRMTVTPRPDDFKLQLLAVGLSIADNALAQNPSWLTNAAWNRAVAETLETAGDVLENYYWTPRDQGNPRLAEVRQFSRAILSRAMEAPVNHALYWFNPEKPPAIKDVETFLRSNSVFTTTNVFEAAAMYSAVFNERGEDTLSMYRKLMSGDAFPYVRKRIFARATQHPLLGGWPPASAARQRSLWNGFLDELSASTNAMLRLEGEFFQLEKLQEGRKALDAISQFSDHVQTNTAATGLYSVPLEFGDDLEALQYFGIWVEEQNAPRASQFLPQFGEHLRFMNGIPEYQRSLREFAALENRFKDHLVQQKPYDAGLFSNYVSKAYLKPDRASTARENLEKYLGFATNATPPLDEVSVREIQAHLQKLARIKTPEEFQKYFHERVEKSQAAARERMRTNPPVIKPPPVVDTNRVVLQVTEAQYWAFPSGTYGLTNPTALPPIYREGKLWFLAFVSDFTRNGYVEHQTLIGIDPRTLQPQIVPVPFTPPERDELVPFFRLTQARHHFEVIGNHFFLVDKTILRRLDFRSRQWTSFPAPAPDGDVYRVGNRLFLTSETGLFEIVENGASFRVFASVRRRPALTPLDKLPDLKRTRILPAADGAIRAFANGTSFRLEGDKWTQELEMTGLRPIVSGDSGLLIGDRELYLLPPTTNKALFVAAASLNDGRTAVPHPRRAEAMFDMPPQFSGARAFIAINGSAALIEPWVKGADDATPATVLISLFDPGEKRPLPILVNFYTMRPKVPGAISGNFMVTNDHLWFQQTPEGLLIGLPDIVGYWKIPQADLDRAIAQAREEVRKKG
jgi:hypothetical protein